MTDISLDLASPPDREKVVVQLMVDNEQVAEVSQETESLQIEIYGRQDGKPWVLDFDDLMLAFRKARAKLVGPPLAGHE